MHIVQRQQNEKRKKKHQIVRYPQAPLCVCETGRGLRWVRTKRTEARLCSWRMWAWLAYVCMCMDRMWMSLCVHVSRCGCG